MNPDQQKKLPPAPAPQTIFKWTRDLLTIIELGAAGAVNRLELRGHALYNEMLEYAVNSDELRAILERGSPGVDAASTSEPFPRHAAPPCDHADAPYGTAPGRCSKCGTLKVRRPYTNDWEWPAPGATTKDEALSASAPARPHHVDLDPTLLADLYKERTAGNVTLRTATRAITEIENLRQALFTPKREPPTKQAPSIVQARQSLRAVIKGLEAWSVDAPVMLARCHAALEALEACPGHPEPPTKPQSAAEGDDWGRPGVYETSYEYVDGETRILFNPPTAMCAPPRKPYVKPELKEKGACGTIPRSIVEEWLAAFTRIREHAASSVHRKTIALQTIDNIALNAEAAVEGWLKAAAPPPRGAGGCLVCACQMGTFRVVTPCEAHRAWRDEALERLTQDVNAALEPAMTAVKAHRKGQTP